LSDRASAYNVLFEKGSTNYQAGTDVNVSWGDEGRPTSAKVGKDVELSWGGELAGQSQFSSSYHNDDSQGL